MTEKVTVRLIQIVVAAIGLCFAVFFFMDERHTHKEELVRAAAELNQRQLMSDSARYAEINVYYTDKLKNGEVLSKADTSRLELVQTQQQRIRDIMIGESDD